MDTYKFETKVLKDGMIKIPQLDKFKDKQIEVFIVLKHLKEIKKEEKNIDEFFDKWVGFAQDVDTDAEKYNYLMEKHR